MFIIVSSDWTYYSHTSVCVCVCVYVSHWFVRQLSTYIHTYLHTNMHAYTHACLATYKHGNPCIPNAGRHSCLPTNMNTYTQVFIHVWLHTYIHIDTHMYVHSHASLPTWKHYLHTYNIYVCLHSCIDIYMYKYKHTGRLNHAQCRQTLMFAYIHACIQVIHFSLKTCIIAEWSICTVLRFAYFQNIHTLEIQKSDNPGKKQKFCKYKS